MSISVLELVDAAIPVEHLEPIRETILQVEGVKVSDMIFLQDYGILLLM